MDRLAQSGPQTDANLAQAMDRLWARFLPEIRERVNVLAEAASAASTNTLSGQQCKAAHEAAHKLAGVLGTFGLSHGTELARTLEMHFSREDGPDPELGKRLTEVAANLQTLIENRRSSA
jgi:HPt (histidine-containing phosphotransfer) domain-containing protein